MGIDHSSQGILTVDLIPEPDMGNELESVARIVRDGEDCDVVVDFSGVDIITSSNIAKLLKLNKALNSGARRLVLCGLANATKQIFTLAGLDQVFAFADDKAAAEKVVRNPQHVSP